MRNQAELIVCPNCGGCGRTSTVPNFYGGPFCLICRGDGRISKMLATLSDEELEKVPVPTKEEIEKIFNENKKIFQFKRFPRYPQR